MTSRTNQKKIFFFFLFLMLFLHAPSPDMFVIPSNFIRKMQASFLHRNLFHNLARNVYNERCTFEQEILLLYSSDTILLPFGIASASARTASLSFENYSTLSLCGCGRGNVSSTESLFRRFSLRCFYDSFYSPIDILYPMPSPVLSSVSGATCSH